MIFVNTEDTAGQWMIIEVKDIDQIAAEATDHFCAWHTHVTSSSAQDDLRQAFKSAIERALKEHDEPSEIAGIKVRWPKDESCAAHASEQGAERAALEQIAKETVSMPCDDPQCGDSTWDHYCTAGRRGPSPAARIAIAALSQHPTPATEVKEGT